MVAEDIREDHVAKRATTDRGGRCVAEAIPRRRRHSVRSEVARIGA